MDPYAYCPFLIPLLSGSSHAKHPVSVETSPGSTLEEENCFCGSSAQEDNIWDILEGMVQEQYGLPLFREIPADSRVKTFGTGHMSPSPERFLVVETGNQTLFLIEHPHSVALIDRYSNQYQVPGIARPTLFARLWREMEASQEYEKSEILSVRERLDEPTTALDNFLSEMLDRDHPSDWHLEPTHGKFRSRIRVDGCLLENGPISSSRGQWFVNSIISRAGIKEKPGRPVEGRLVHQLPSGNSITLRISIIPARHGMAMAVRFLYPLDSTLLQLESLGIPDRARMAFNQPFSDARGLWIAAGPTGAGKSTTLRALLHLSVKSNEKVLSVEDPVEYTLPGAHQLSLGSPPGLTWAAAIRAFLRQAPDTILVGEIRDEETAAISLQAARTGHRVLTSLHARDNPGIKRRFLDLGQDERSLESAFEYVLHQRLLPRLCPKCRRLESLPDRVGDSISYCDLPKPDKIAMPVGCQECCGGRKGRLAIFTSGDFSSELPVAVELRKAAWKAFTNLQISLTETIPYLPREVRSRLEFANGKVSVKTT